MTTRYSGPKRPKFVELTQLAYSDQQVGEGVAQYDLLYYRGAILFRADPQASSTMPAAGMALASALSGGYVDLLKRGIVSNGGWALASGDFVYAASGSTVTATPPSASGEIIQRLGTAMTAESIDFEAEDNYTTITV